MIIGRILALAVLLPFAACDFGASDPQSEVTMHEEKDMAIRFLIKPDYVITPHHDSALADVNIYSRDLSRSWLMGGERLRSSATPTSDSEDIETQIRIVSVAFPNAPPLRSTRTIASAGTYIVLSGVVTVKDSAGVKVDWQQEIYYLAKNGGVYFFSFVSKVSELKASRKEFEDFFTSIVYE
jgi:hypothetical protein